jgi:hypothetical protein
MRLYEVSGIFRGKQVCVELLLGSGIRNLTVILSAVWWTPPTSGTDSCPTNGDAE